MTTLIIFLILALLIVIAVQIGRVTELAKKIRGEEEAQISSNGRHGAGMMAFLVAFFGIIVWSTLKYKNYYLGYGPHQSASVHGAEIDTSFNVTLFFTGIVFVLTTAALCYFAWKYRGVPGRVGQFLVHDTKLEIIWTAIPAVVMCFLVVNGLVAWNNIMADIEPGEDYIEIEATGSQFLWYLRYPGADGKLGGRDYKKINATNPLGQDWKDTKNLDDIQPTDIVLPRGKKVRVRITARDVLHNFYLPQFRVKMDAVPGMPTYFVFTPEKTTDEYRQELRKYPEYNVPSDPKDPSSPKLWETFEFELACAELCGKGHFSMKKIVKVVEEEEYEAWLATQPSYYLSSIRNTENDPYKGDLLDIEVKMRKAEFTESFDKAMKAEVAAEKVVRLKYVTFETGSAQLTPLSRYELDNVIEVMKNNAGLKIELAGHTDNTGDAAANMSLSQSRASSVYNYLTSKGMATDRLTARGYGQNEPVDSNDTDAGRENNRRTEFRIIAQ